MSRMKSVLAIAASVGLALSTATSRPAIASVGQIEPQAGNWRTWVLDSGSQLRLPAPEVPAAAASGLAFNQAMRPERSFAGMVLRATII